MILRANKSIKSNNGFTIVELIVATNIMLIIMGPLSYMLYSSYTIYTEENDKMICMDTVNEAIEVIMDDLRKYEGSYDESYTSIVSISVLNITSSAIYSYNATDKTIEKNNVSIIPDEYVIQVNDFRVEQKSTTTVSGVTYPLDSPVIEITVEAVYGESGIVTMSNSYRRKK